MGERALDAMNKMEPADGGDFGEADGGGDAG